MVEWGVKLSEYTNHSGGCPGADMTWEALGYDYGVTTVAYSFYNHVQESKNQKILTFEELKEGFSRVELASKSLNRNIYGLYPYVKNLLARNWFQVKNSEAIYPIGTFLDYSYTIVNGGTGWAVQMAIDIEKPIFFFDQESKKWYQYSYDDRYFIVCTELPKLTQNFAGIGTRTIDDSGISAIHQIYEHTFA